MGVIGVIIHRYVISFIDKFNRCDIQFFFCIDQIYSIFIKCMDSYFWWNCIRLNLLTYIVLISSFIVDTNTWLCICYF